MNIWISGGAGFVGTRLGKELRRQGHRVVSLSRRESSECDESYAVDLSRPDSVLVLTKALATSGRPDIVINAASRQPGSAPFSDFARSNAASLAYLLEGLTSAPPRQFIQLSTLSVYARTRLLPVTEDRPATADSPYAISKRLGEQIALTFRLSQVFVLRLPSLYGKGQGDSFIDGLTRTAMTNEPLELYSKGQLVRDTLHVSDLIAAIKLIFSAELPNNSYVINLGCGRPITSLEYAEVLVETLGSQSEIRCTERSTTQFDLYANIERAQQLLGFHPTELRESIKRYVDELRT